MDKLTAVKAFAQTQIEFAKKEFSDDNAPYEMKLKIRGRSDAFQQVVDYIELIEKEEPNPYAPIAVRPVDKNVLRTNAPVPFTDLDVNLKDN